MSHRKKIKRKIFLRKGSSEKPKLNKTITDPDYFKYKLMVIKANN